MFVCFFFHLNIDLNVGTRRAWLVFHMEILKKPLNLFSSHTELRSLVRPIVSAAVHGKTRSRTDFHGSLDIEMFKFIYFSNAQIEISINWCMERGHVYLHRHHRRQENCDLRAIVGNVGTIGKKTATFVLYRWNRWQEWKYSQSMPRC